MKLNKKLFGKVSAKWFHGYRKNWKKLRSHVGLTSKNKWVRQIKRSLKGGSYHADALAGAPVSAYTYQGRTLSQLMGGN